MSLFVGNVSKHVSHRQLENLFKKFGKCRIDLRDRYAFVQFDNDNHAEAGKKQLQHQTFHGLQLNIQWSKNSGRFGQNNKRKDGGGGGGQRKRSRSRENRWRRDDRWGRRSPSNQRRSSPSYSQNKDFQSFQPKCPRDQIILKKLVAKAKQQEKKYRQLSNKSDHENRKHQVQSVQIPNQNNLENNQNDNNISSISVININEGKIQKQQQEGLVQEDGQIQTAK